MQDLALDDSRHLLDLAELCLNRISELCDTRRDQAHFASACRALRETTPRQALVISGPDFTLRGPHGGHWAPEAYFQTPALPAALAGLKMSLAWKDQGWGNRKGTIVVRLMRRPPRDEVEAVVAEDTSLFGVAPHAWEDGLVELDAAHPIVSQAEAGDTLSFLRNAGGGGGHSLSVKSFRVELALRPGAIG
mmetsp:Transcript_10201/g.32731  ORF Transcript_10201/g.32731 Transcript_10201/m.32731 type:complete len:191 (+) Transcript_10201:61-633(+)